MAVKEPKVRHYQIELVSPFSVDVYTVAGKHGERDDAEDQLHEVWLEQRLNELNEAHALEKSWDVYTDKGSKAWRVRCVEVYEDGSKRSLADDHRPEPYIDPKTIDALFDLKMDEEAIVETFGAWYCLADDNMAMLRESVESHANRRHVRRVREDFSR